MTTAETIKKHNFQNFSFMGKEIETKKKIRVKSIDFQNQKIIGESKKGELKEYDYSQIRLLAYTRMRDINKRRIYENSYVRVIRENKQYEGFVIFRRAWGVMNYKTGQFTRFIKKDKLEKLKK